MFSNKRARPFEEILDPKVIGVVLAEMANSIPKEVRARCAKICESHVREQHALAAQAAAVLPLEAFHFPKFKGALWAN